MTRIVARRWMEIRTGLFFLAAAVWIVGVVIDGAIVRWVAMGIAVIALILGQIARRQSARADSRLEDDE